MAKRVVLDTNVLYPVHLRISLLSIQTSFQAESRKPDEKTDLFVPLWSEDILAELRRNLRVGGLGEGAVTAAIRRLRSDHPTAEVKGYQYLVAYMTCDPNDRHVLAAAIHGNAEEIVTRNTRDFPLQSVEPYGVNVTHPDDFLLRLFRMAKLRVIAALEQLVYSNKPGQPKTLTELADALEKAGTPEFADQLRQGDSSPTKRAGQR